MYKGTNIGGGLIIYHFRAATGLDGYLAERFLQDPDDPTKIVLIKGRAFDGFIPRVETWYKSLPTNLTSDEFIKKTRIEFSEDINYFMNNLDYFKRHFNEVKPVGSEELLKLLVHAMAEESEGFLNSGYIRIFE